METPNIIDKLFEKFKILEEENKILEKEEKELDYKLITKENSQLSKLWLDEKGDIQCKREKERTTKEICRYKKMLEENIRYTEKANTIEPITISNTKFDEINIINFFKLLNQEKRRNSMERQNALDKINGKISSSKPSESTNSFLINEFEKTFKGRIINYNGNNHIIKGFNQRDKNIKVMLLYDPNGIKVDMNSHDKMMIFSSIELSSLLETAYILSKEESDKIISDFKKDSKNYIKIFYMLQVDKNNPREKDLIPYRIEPNYIDINDYNFKIQNNSIRYVQNREKNCFVTFDSVLIGDGKNTTGLVSTSSIKVYTTLYSKDILNIFHIHLNDTSQEITIDSEFLEKNERILNHKIFNVDSSGKRLTYKLLFKDYKLIKIYYAMSNNYIDEPPFEEVRICPNNLVKIIKGEYKNYFGRVKDLPIGMLARKDKELSDVNKVRANEYQKEGKCGDRHLEELPGFVSVEVIFINGDDFLQLEEPINISIPVCFLVPLSAEEQVDFEKNIIIKKEFEIQETCKKLDAWEEKCKLYETFINNDKILEEKKLDDIKEILSNIEKIEVEKIEQNNIDEYEEKIKYIKEIKNKVQPLLIQKIRLFTLTGHK